MWSTLLVTVITVVLGFVAGLAAGAAFTEFLNEKFPNWKRHSGLILIIAVVIVAIVAASGVLLAHAVTDDSGLSSPDYAAMISPVGCVLSDPIEDKVAAVEGARAKFYDALTGSEELDPAAAATSGPQDS